LATETDYFVGLLSKSLPQNIYIPSQDIPIILSPKDIGNYQQIKRREADVLLYFILSFEEKEDKSYDDSLWIYASVEFRLQDSLEEKELWKTHFHTDKGVISWKGKQQARKIAVEELSQKTSEELNKILSSLSLYTKNKIRLSAFFDTQEQLQLFQNELARLEKSKHFHIQKNLLVVSTFLGATLESEQDLLSLKLLLEQACQSVGIAITISMGQKSILLESKD